MRGTKLCKLQNEIALLNLRKFNLIYQVSDVQRTDKNANMHHAPALISYKNMHKLQKYCVKNYNHREYSMIDYFISQIYTFFQLTLN